jgi:hypothetical protein
VFQANPQPPRIVHNVDSGYITELGAKAVPGCRRCRCPVVDDKRADGTDTLAPRSS